MKKKTVIIKSAELVKEGKFTWWEDDTHWNGLGISVAANIVAQTLKQK